jgi:uncharacterized damage-inducible protein DinB
MPEETKQPTQLTVLNRAPESMVVAQKFNALSRLFQLKPKTLELVSKSTRQEGATPGTFRVTSTNESFKELRVVMLAEPVEQREKYRKGEYTKDSKECFSLDNVQPHPRARTPFALYCANCPQGDINWVKYREAKAKGITGDALSAYLPPCRKFWHLFIASRETQRPYYFNIKGGSVKPFEDAMQNVADLFQMIYQNIKQENRHIAAANAKNSDGPQIPLKSLPETVGDIIWHISFTMYAWNRNGGPWMVGFKDFKVMSEEDRKDFGKIIEDIKARRAAGQLQSQEASEAEEENAVVEQPASSGIRTAEVVSVTTNEVAQKNAQIQI